MLVASLTIFFLSDILEKTVDAETLSRIALHYANFVDKKEKPTPHLLEKLSIHAFLQELQDVKLCKSQCWEGLDTLAAADLYEERCKYDCRLQCV